MTDSDSTSPQPEESPREFASSPCYLHEFADFDDHAPEILVERIYDKPATGNAKRFLIDRLWPRGISRQEAALDGWLKDIAPTARLRQWFHKNPQNWDAFKREYLLELKQLKAEGNEQLGLLEQAVKSAPVVLLYGSRNRTENHAHIIKGFLMRGT